MGKRLTWMILAIAGVLFAVAGCKLPFWSELYGTWVMAEGGDSWAVKFSANDMSWKLSGSETGTLEFTIDEVDDTANHVLMILSAGTGVFSGAEIGTVLYLTYSISGDSLYFDLDDTTYPATATIGPFIKQ